LLLLLLYKVGRYTRPFRETKEKKLFRKFQTYRFKWVAI